MSVPMYGCVVCLPCVCRYTARPEEGDRCSGAGVSGGFESPDADTWN